MCRVWCTLRHCTGEGHGETCSSAQDLPGAAELHSCDGQSGLSTRLDGEKPRKLVKHPSMCVCEDVSRMTGLWDRKTDGGRPALNVGGTIQWQGIQIEPKQQEAHLGFPLSSCFLAAMR